MFIIYKSLNTYHYQVSLSQRKLIVNCCNYFSFRHAFVARDKKETYLQLSSINEKVIQNLCHQPLPLLVAGTEPPVNNIT